MQNKICLSASGVLSLTAAAGDVLTIDYALYDHLGADAVLDVSFSLTGTSLNATPTILNTVVGLVWRDRVTNDVIYLVDGVAGLSIDANSSLLSRADATESFSVFDVAVVEADFAAAVAACDAYNAPNGLGRKKVTLTLPDDQPTAFDDTAVFDAITLMQPRPSYIVLPKSDSLPLLTVAQRAVQVLNIPLTIELDSSLTVDQAADFANTLDIQDSRVDLLWNVSLSRPRDARSLRGAKKPRPVCGWVLGQKLLRNARVNAQGIPPIDTPIGGYDFPLTFSGMEMRPDIVLNAQNRQKLAVAKVNTVQRIDYDTGSRFVISDLLTQHRSENSALRLVNSSEIACYTTNVCIDILKRHMLKKMSSFLQDADRDIMAFLSACASAGLLQKAENLGGKAFDFSLTPDEVYPFERVRFKLERRPEGAVRSVIFDEDVIVR